MWIVVLAFLAFIFVILLIQIQKAGGRQRRGNEFGSGLRGEDGLNRDQFARSHASTALASDVSELSVIDSRHGDVISIPGQGDDYSDLEFTVDRRNRYESGGDEWFELSGLYKGRRVHVEVEEGDTLQVLLLANEDGPRLDELGLSEEDLIRMDEDQSRRNRFTWNGHEWTFDSSQEIGYFKDGRGDGEGYYNWDFESDDGELLLSIEKWEGQPFEVLVSKRVHPDDIRVYRR